MVGAVMGYLRLMGSVLPADNCVIRAFMSLLLNVLSGAIPDPGEFGFQWLNCLCSPGNGRPYCLPG